MPISSYSNPPTIDELRQNLCNYVKQYVEEEILKPVNQEHNYYPSGVAHIRVSDTIVIGIDLDAISGSVENGRKSGKMPPTSEIAKWISKKGITPRDKHTIPQLSYVIARSIGKHGTEGKHYLQKQFDANPLPDGIKQVLTDYFEALAAYHNEINSK